MAKTIAKVFCHDIVKHSRCDLLGLLTLLGIGLSMKLLADVRRDFNVPFTEVTIIRNAINTELYFIIG